MICDLVNRKLHSPGFLGVAETVEPEVLEVRDQDKAGPFVGTNAPTVQIVQHLVIGSIQWDVEAFGFPNDHARPKEVDIPTTTGRGTVRVAFKHVSTLRCNIEALH